MSLARSAPSSTRTDRRHGCKGQRGRTRASGGHDRDGVADHLHTHLALRVGHCEHDRPLHPAHGCLGRAPAPDTPTSTRACSTSLAMPSPVGFVRAASTTIAVACWSSSNAGMPSSPRWRLDLEAAWRRDVLQVDRAEGGRHRRRPDFVDARGWPSHASDARRVGHREIIASLDRDPPPHPRRPPTGASCPC